MYYHQIYLEDHLSRIIIGFQIQRQFIPIAQSYIFTLHHICYVCMYVCINYFVCPLFTDELVSKLRGEAVVLTCPIDVTSCGELHSVKWFKGRDRVAVVSGDGAIENVEGNFSER